MQPSSLVFGKFHIKMISETAAKSGQKHKYEFRKNVSLKEIAHYHIGGPAKYYAEPETVEDLKAALGEAVEMGERIFIMGRGTNLIISDKGFDGVVIRPNLRELKVSGNEILTGAGVQMRELLEFAAENSLSGLEWAGGLPGTVGGAVRGNAGAFGGETKDHVKSVFSVDIFSLKEIERSVLECGFGYRNSVFKNKAIGEVITSVVFSLLPGDEKNIRKIIEEKISCRAERHPMDFPSAGSVFKNVPVACFKQEMLDNLRSVIKTDPFLVIPVAYLISECGLKGVKLGGAKISEKHPNFIINENNASSEDVLGLIQKIKNEVRKKFGVEIEEEIMSVS